MKLPSISCLMIAASLLPSSGALAADSADAINVVDHYVRQMPPGAPATGAFMVLKNSGSKEVRLVGVASPASKLTELHTHLHEDGVMKMRPVKEIPIPAKGETALKPGGYHIMMIDLKEPMKEGDLVPLTLTFDDGSRKLVKTPVKKPLATTGPKTQ